VESLTDLRSGRHQPGEHEGEPPATDAAHGRSPVLQQRAKLAVGVAASVLADSGVRLEHRPQPVLRAASLIA
jgi:hypothetical protein